MDSGHDCILNYDTWKPFHFISTISTACGASENAPLDRKVLQELTAPSQKHNGYVSSKFVAEYNVLRAVEAGAPCTVFRPGQ